MIRKLFCIGSQVAVVMLYSGTAAATPVPSIPPIAAGEVGMLSLVSLGVAGAIWLASRKQ